MMAKGLAAGGAALALVACGQGEVSPDPEPTAEQVAAIPESLAPFGDGYPNAGDPCRRLGESAATANYLDDSAVLVGCPSEAAAQALGGQVVDTIDGVTLVSVPMDDANAGMGESGDALVAGTDYNATTILDCGFDGKPPTQSCEAGVKRNWSERPDEHLVEVQKPDGRTRAIFFRGTEPFSADSAQSDGSAGWDFETSRDGDRVTISYGPETYVVVDALITGG